jgi:hypothetical protein
MFHFALPTADRIERRHACLEDEGETGGAPCQTPKLSLVHNGRSGSSVLFLADQMVLLLSIVKHAADSGYYVDLCGCVVQ